MAPSAIIINDLLNTLEEDDYKAAISYIEYLAESRKRKRAEESKYNLNKIQNMFVNDKGWESEEEMLKDMANFRKERTDK